jgi:oligoendopeptidase F
LPLVRRMPVRLIAAVLALPMAALAQPPAGELPTREQIPEKYKWNLAEIYADRDAWEGDFARCETMIADLAARKGSLAESPESLLAVLQLRDEAYWLADKLLVYAHQLSDQDMTDSEPLGLKSRSSALSVSFDEASSWIEPALQAMPEDTLRTWCGEQADLAVYKHYFDDVLRRKPHTLSSQGEELLAMAGNLAEAPQNAFAMLSNAELIWPMIEDEQGEPVQLSTARYNRFIQSTDRRVRRDAFFGCMKAFSSFENTFAATMDGTVQRDLYFARARGFDSCLQAALFPDNLPMSVYTNLVDTVNRHLPLLHRWAALRKRASGLDELHAYDLYQPIVSDACGEYPYDQAVEMIVAAMAPLGAEYCQPMADGFRSRWVDVYEAKGKRSGGYAWGSYDTHPYILLNHNGTLRDASIIAHEMGHAMHSFLTNKHQPKVHGRYSDFVAEVAAIFNEMLLEDYMLAHAEDRAERLRLLNHMIDQVRLNVFRQVMFAEFELAIHQMAERGEPLTAESMGRLYLDIFHKYWGPAVVRDPEHAVYWARIPHFYSDFYVYRYATSYCAAAALARDVLDEKPEARDAYLGLLKAGSSDYPLVLLRRAGVDMTAPAPIEAAMKRLQRLLEEMETLLAG